ncbi:MAG: response regulator [Gemmatimonadales bacterium]|nr:MAG: response regulator [Gemmatimonadales bacterium]
MAAARGILVHRAVPMDPARGGGLMTQRMLRPAGSLRLLVAEDEPHIRRILVTLLEASGFQLTVAHDGLAAQAELEGPDEFDLALLDLLMPGRTGLEVLKTARSLPHRRDLPVIILTAKGQDVDRRRAFDLGADDFITKPFSPKKLLGRVDELLADR